MPRLLLQPVPARRTDEEHTGLLLRQPGFPLRARHLIPALLATIALAGCAGAQERPCTAVGARVGVGLQIEPPYAERVAKAAMKVCWDGSCTTPDLRLHEETTAEPGSCSGTAPDDACGATAVPTGGKRGFADVADLPREAVRVTVTLSDAEGRRLLRERVTVTPDLTYPNGRRCDDEGAPQVHLVVDDGRLRAR